MRSVLYAPDMWVSLGHSSGKVFVTMPRNSARLEADWQPTARPGDERAASLAERGRDPRRRRRLERGAADGAAQPVAARAAHGQAAGRRRQPRRRPTSSAPGASRRSSTRSSSSSSPPRRRSACTAASGGAGPSPALEASAARERRQSAEQLELALQGADLGLWDWDLRGDRFEHNQVTRQQLGYEPGDIGAFGGEWHAIIHPVDRARMLAAIEAHFRGETAAYECEFRVRHKHGHWVWLLSRGKVVERDEYGIAVRMAGTHMDLTRRKAHRGADGALGRDAASAPASWRRSAAGSSTSRPCALDWTEQVFRIHELEPGGHAARSTTRSTSTRRKRSRCIRAAIAAGARDGTPWDLELPFVTAKGNPRWVRAQGIAAMRGRPAGAPARRLPGHHREEDDRCSRCTASTSS